MTEQDLNNAFCEYFKQWFDIQKEIHPVGNSQEIDLLLTLKSDKRFVFGVELKHDKTKQGTSTKNHILQGVRYSKQKFIIWDGKFERYIPILLYPSISDQYVQVVETIEPLIQSVTYTHSRSGEVRTEDKEFRATYHDKLFLHSNSMAFLEIHNLGEIRKCYTGWEKSTYQETKLGYGFIFANSLMWHEKIGICKDKYNDFFKEINPLI